MNPPVQLNFGRPPTGRFGHEQRRPSLSPSSASRRQCTMRTTYFCAARKLTCPPTVHPAPQSLLYTEPMLTRLMLILFNSEPAPEPETAPAAAEPATGQGGEEVPPSVDTRHRSVQVQA
ncbi:hypothetical protein BDZ89DRAFT_405381 [Hymenopellis radicata]|nr:hypothetical protein BDZ89DRAFT_405381 [Hymenopellis radicata]